MLATLLSIILVVGLSPIGKAPTKAWADSKELSTYCYVTVDSGIAYKGSSWLTSSTDGLLGSKIHVWKADGDTEIDSPTSDSNIASATYKDSNGNAVTSIVDAGTYSVTLTGAGGYAGTTVTQSFTVEPYDISDATWTTETTTADANTTYPYVDIYGNLNAKTYNGSYQATSPAGHTFNFKNDSNEAASVTIPVTTTPATVKDFTSGTTVTATATGNFTGSVTATMKVARGTFAGAANRATVTGLTWADTNDLDYETGTFADQTYGATSDPVTTVTYGAAADALVRDTNYTVTYQRTKDGSGTAVTEDATTTAPSELGAYTVTIAGAGNNFDTSSSDNAITVTYSIVAASVGAAKVTFDNGTYAGGAAVEADVETAKVYDSDGADVTSSAGTVAVSTYAAWSASLEKSYLGEDAYLAKYGAAGYPESSIGALDNSKPKTAGDYAVEVTVGSATISNMKFTVDPAVLSEGTSVGDLLVDTSVSASTTADDKNVYNGEGAITTAPSVGIITEVDTSTSTSTPAYTTTELAAGTDYTVAYYQDGEEVTPKAAGTYDAVFTFKGGMEGSASITAEGALVINALPISTAVTDVTFASKMYTGAGVDAVPTWNMAGDYSSVELTTDDYALSYNAGASGTLTTDGKPLIPATTYTVTVSGQGNYTDSLTAASFSVTALDISDDAYTTVQFQQADGTWADSYRTLFVSGETYEPAVRLVTAATASDDSPTVIPSSLYTVSYSDNATAGTATVTLASVSGSDYVTADKSRTASFYLTTSTFAADGGAVALSASNVDYVPGNTTTSLTPTVTVSTTSKGVLTDDYYTVAVTDSEGEAVTKVIDAGTYTVTVTGGTNGYYAGELSATFTVDPFEITQDDVYDESASPSGTVYITTNSESYTGSEITGITKAEYFEDGYSSDANVTDTLYDASASENPSCTVTGATATDAGTYTATLEFGGNYTGTVTKTWEVTALDSASLTFYLDGLNWTTMTVGSEMSTKTSDLYAPAYTGNAWAPAVTIFNDTVDVTSDVAPTVIYEDNVDAGNAAITVIASGNYAFNIELGFAISKIDLEAALAAGTLDVAFADTAYTGSAVEPTPTISFSASDGTTYELGADDYAISYEGAPVNAGSTGTATIVGKGNFGSHNQVADNGNVGYITATYTVTQADQAIAASATSVKPVFKKSSTVTIEGAKGELTATPSDGTGSVTATVDGDKVVITGTKAGTASVKVAAAATADGNYAASNEVVVDVTVTKAANTLTVKAVKATQKAKASKKTVIKAAKAFKVTKNASKGKVTYQKAKGAAKIKVASNGKVTVAKGLKAGKVYTVKVKVTSKATVNYEAASKTVTFKVKVTK